MRFPAARLVTSGGGLYAHLFENPATGLARDAVHEALRPFIDGAAYHALEQEGHGFNLRPRW